MSPALCSDCFAAHLVCIMSPRETPGMLGGRFRTVSGQASHPGQALQPASSAGFGARFRADLEPILVHQYGSAPMLVHQMAPDAFSWRPFNPLSRAIIIQPSVWAIIHC